MSLAQKLQNTEIGKELTAELKQLETRIYDARTWPPGFTKEMADVAAKPVRDFITSLTLIPEMKDENPNICE